MPRLFAMFGCAVVVLAPAPARSQNLIPPVDAKLLASVSAYRAATDAYRHDHTAEAIQALGQLSRSDLQAVVAMMKRLRNLPRSGGASSSTPYGQFRWDTPMLVAAGMLHFEAAVAASRLDNAEAFNFHADLADRVLAIADQPDPDTNDPPGTFGRRSALALGLFLLGESKLGLTRLYLIRAIERFPDDGELLLTLGIAIEDEADEPPPWLVNNISELAHARGRRETALKEAAQFFTRAIAARPTLVEARVRLAHVQIVQHGDGLAAPLLEQTLASNPPPALKYLTRLMLGGVRERAGQTQAAGQLYSDAIRDHPDGQSAYVALSHLLHSTGDHRAAAVVIERLRSRRLTQTSSDPWWEYPFGSWRVADEMLSALRMAARQ